MVSAAFILLALVLIPAIASFKSAWKAKASPKWQLIGCVILFIGEIIFIFLT